MGTHKSIVLLALLFCLGVLTSATPGKKVLVLSDQPNITTTHSLFFKSLKDRGYELTFMTADDPALILIEYGVYLYDHLIVFAPKVEEFGGLIDAAAIIDFIDSGRNVIIAADTTESDPNREIAQELGITPDFSLIVDHIHHDKNGEDDHGRLVVELGDNMEAFVGKEKIGPILYRGCSLTLNPKSVREGLLYSVLSARHTSYPRPKATLVAALQARNNARVIFSGSLALFSDEYFKAQIDGTSQKYGNEKFVTEITRWAFKERSVLRASNVRHHRISETTQQDVYRIVDNITFAVDIEEWNGNEWVPYKADDVQLEFIMLDPYIRKYMKHDGKGTFSLDFTLPDVYGVFTFKIDYHRYGYTNLLVETRVQVRPFRHNEYERFISSAFPYYTAVFSMLVGVFLFSCVFVYHKDRK